MTGVRTRLSLFYVAAYLTTSALGLTFVPQLTLRLLLATGSYDSTPMRFAGLFIGGLAAVVVQVIRLRIDALHGTLIAVRVVFCIAYVALFAQTGDRFFLVVLAIVGLGLTASSVGYARDRRAERRAPLGSAPSGASR